MSYAQATSQTDVVLETATDVLVEAAPDVLLDAAPPRLTAVEAPAPRPRRRVGRPPIEDSIEIVMPAQFHTPASEAWWPGEKRLMLAVLTDAVDILTKGPGASGQRRVVYDETAEWLASDDREWPYSFVNVCDTLELDTSAVRSALRRRLDPRRTSWAACARSA